MPRDYAKKKKSQTKKRGASRGKQQRKVPLRLWFFTVSAVIALAAGLSYLKWNKPAKNSVVATKTPQPSASQKPATTKTNLDDEVPFYDLHEDLTNKKVEIPQEDLKLPQNYKKYQYTMPCGSFRDPARAEKLKAQIAFSGSNSTVASVKWQGETWYRVQLGPYSSKRTAEKIRHRLQDNGIQDCRITRNLKP